MSTTKKVWIGISTFAPFVVLFFIFISYFSMIASFATNPEEPNVGMLFGSFFGFFISYILLLATKIINVIVYVSHIVKNEKLEKSSKILWICLMFFFSVIVNIVYFFMYIISDKLPVNDPSKVY